VRSSGWLLLGVTALTISLGALIVWSTRFDGCAQGPAGCEVDTTRIALSGVYVGQVAAVLLGVLPVSSEYATGTIRTTLAAGPRRWPTFVAKAAVVAGPVLLAAALAVVGSLVVGRAFLPANGFTPARGFPPLSLGDPATFRAGVGTALYLCLIALLSVGVALTVRNTAAAISTVLSLLFVFPILGTLVTEPHWREWLTDWSPMSAGLAVQATRGLDAMPVGPWQGLSVSAAYAAAALLLGGILFQVRDA
jgi:ABC-2 type transport system permease protein